MKCYIKLNSCFRSFDDSGKSALTVKFFKAILLVKEPECCILKRGENWEGWTSCYLEFPAKDFYMTVFTTIINSETLQKGQKCTLLVALERSTF